jgi:hypothetical protein
MLRKAVLFLFCLLVSRTGKAQQPLVPANPPTPPGYKYQYRVIAQTGGPIRTQEGVKTIQAINQYALGQNGEVAFIAQMNAPPTDSGQVALFKSDGTLVAETGKPFNGRLIREFQDVLGFGTGGALFFVAKSADSEHPNDQPAVTFFGTDGTAYIPKGKTIAGCQLLSDPTKWAFSQGKGDFAFDSSSYPTGPPRNCGYLEYLTRTDLIEGQRMMEGTALIPRDMIYQDKVYYLGMVGNPSHGYVFRGSEELLKLPDDTVNNLHFSISATGDIFLARTDGIYKFTNQNGTLDSGSQIVSVGTLVDGYRLLNVESPIQTRGNLFYWGRFDYQGTTRRTGNLHGGVAIFDHDGPVVPVLQEAAAPWNLFISLTTSSFFANDAGQMLNEITIGSRNVLLLSTPSATATQSNCRKPGDSGEVNIDRHPQQEPSWCWVATAEILMQSVKDGKDHPQCEIYDNSKSKVGCCSPENLKKDYCDEGGLVSAALNAYKYTFVQFSDAPTWEQITEQISCSIPIGVDWVGDWWFRMPSRHQVVLHGYVTLGDKRYVRVYDPFWFYIDGKEIFGIDRLILYSDFVSKYTDPFTNNYWRVVRGYWNIKAPKK